MEKWDQQHLSEYTIQMPGVNVCHSVKADSEVFDIKGFLFLYVEGSLVARVPREALVIKTGKLHK